MGAILDLIGQLMGSNTPTILSCLALAAAGAFYWFKVIPSLEQLKEYKRKEEEGVDSSDLSEGLESIKSLISELKKEGHDPHSLQVISDVLRAVHELERTLNSHGRDVQFTTGAIRDLMISLNTLHTEVSAIRQKLNNLSGAIYSSTTGAHDDDRLGDLRSLR